MKRIEIGAFTLVELGARSADKLWRRGGLPLPHLARSEADSMAWRKQFIRTQTPLPDSPPRDESPSTCHADPPAPE